MSLYKSKWLRSKENKCKHMNMRWPKLANCKTGEYGKSAKGKLGFGNNLNFTLMFLWLLGGFSRNTPCHDVRRNKECISTIKTQHDSFGVWETAYTD
jgi:hypothetical protein